MRNRKSSHIEEETIKKLFRSQRKMQKFFLQIEPTKYPNRNWMEKHSDVLETRPIRDLLIVGSHDAGSYSISHSSPFSAELTDYFALTLAKNTVYQWSKTQEATILEQLFMGVRYFDIRLQYIEKSDEFLIHHGLLGESILDICYQISTFLDQHKREVVIVRISHLLCFTPEAHVVIVSLKNLEFSKVYLRKPDLLLFFFFKKRDWSVFYWIC